jgi:hypothetical protein
MVEALAWHPAHTRARSPLLLLAALLVAFLAPLLGVVGAPHVGRMTTCFASARSPEVAAAPALAERTNEGATVRGRSTRAEPRAIRPSSRSAEGTRVSRGRDDDRAGPSRVWIAAPSQRQASLATAVPLARFRAASAHAGQRSRSMLMVFLN